VALTAYVQQVQRLLHDTTGQFYQYQDIVYYINVARGQVAVEGECTRALTSLTTVIGQQEYLISSLGSLPSGVQAALVVRGLYANGKTLEARPWDWFANLYFGTGAVPAIPVWSQLGVGSSAAIYIAPVPTSIVVYQADAVLQPVALVTDADTEIIPYPWTDAIPYYAAYLAYMDAQRTQDAQLLLQMYTLFTNRARKITTPTNNARQQYGQMGTQIVATETGLANGVGAPNA
jgi:hypothetical protein